MGTWAREGTIHTVSSLFTDDLKLHLLSKLNNFVTTYHTYIIIKAFCEGICVEFKQKTNNPTLVFLLLKCPQVQNIFYD